MRQKFIKTDGVRQTGPEVARYKARVNWVIRRVREDRPVIQTNYSYEDTGLTCTGAVLQGTTHKGASMPSFEPIQTSAR